MVSHQNCARVTQPRMCSLVLPTGAQAPRGGMRCGLEYSWRRHSPACFWPARAGGSSGHSLSDNLSFVPFLMDSFLGLVPYFFLLVVLLKIPRLWGVRQLGVRLLISSQVMISGARDWAPSWALCSAWGLLGILSLPLPLPLPPLTCVHALSLSDKENL